MQHRHRGDEGYMGVYTLHDKYFNKKRLENQYDQLTAARGIVACGKLTLAFRAKQDKIMLLIKISFLMM